MKWLHRPQGLLYLLCFLSLLPACQIDGDEPMIDGRPKVSVEESGFVLAGSTDARLSTIDLGTAVHVDGQSGSLHTFSLVLDSTSNTTLQIAASYSSSPTGTYRSTNVGGTGGIEIAYNAHSDSLWHCESWPWDSSQGTIYDYNSLSAHQCAGNTLYWTGMESKNSVTQFMQNDRIDGNFPNWSTQGVTFNEASSEQHASIHPNGAYVYSYNLRTYDFWNANDYRFVGFRWFAQNRYHYGYAKVFAQGTWADLSQVVYEP